MMGRSCDFLGNEIYTTFVSKWGLLSKPQNFMGILMISYEIGGFPIPHTDPNRILLYIIVL